MYVYSLKSQDRLETCCPDLIKLFNEVIKYRDCTIICGRREKQAQDKAYADGKSKVKYPSSYHNRYPSMAVDVAPYPIDWEDMDRFKAFGHFVLGVAAVLEIPVEWGGKWKFKDYPHFQIGG